MADFYLVLSSKLFFNSLGIDNFCTFSTNFSAFADFDFLYAFNTSLSALSRLPSFCMLIGTTPRFEAPVLNLRLTQLYGEFLTPFYRIGASVNYVSYVTKHLSNSLITFFKISEFRHSFCKNFYVANFLTYPCIIIGAAGLNSAYSHLLVNAVHIFLDRLILFGGAALDLAQTAFTNNFIMSNKFVSVLHLYAVWLQLLDVGMLNGLRNFFYYKDSVVCKASCLTYYAIHYFVGFDSTTLEQHFLNDAVSGGGGALY